MLVLSYRMPRDTEPRNVQMYIPKFKITAKYGSDATIPAFGNLGIYDLFSSRADLSGKVVCLLVTFFMMHL